jgi:Cobalamin biosynthesis protein CobD/CbiB
VTAAWWQLLAGFGLDLRPGRSALAAASRSGFGWLAARLERIARTLPIPLRLSGALFWIAAVASAGLLVWFTTPWLNIFWIWTLLAVRDLDFEAGRVLKDLRNGDCRQPAPTSR